jgi:radical SAM protein with 4Fe4S-binding SPASM domain
LIYKTFQSYRDAWKNAETETPPVPLNVDIELTSVCNLRCPFCFTVEPNFKGIVKTESMRFILFDYAFKAIDECHNIGVPALKFNWRGESTLHRDFNRITRYAKDKKSFHELLLNTNGNVPEENFEGLMNLTKVMFSCDSFNPTTYQKMRVKGNLEKLKNTIKFLIKRNHPNIWLRRVITQVNKNEDFKDDCIKIFGDKVNVSEHYEFDRISNQKPLSDEERICLVNRRYCGYPSKRLVIACTGKIFPCCIDYNGEMRLGNISENSIKEIWNGETLHRLRDSLKSNIFYSEACKNCHSWMGYDSFKRNFVEDKKNENSLRNKGLD